MNLTADRLLSILDSTIPSRSGLTNVDHFYFHRGKVIAYYDYFHVAAECPFPVEGMIPAKLLLDLLDTMPSESEITIERWGGRIWFRCDGCSWTGLRSFDAHPDTAGWPHFKMRAPLISLLAEVAQFGSRDVSVPDYLGVTLQTTGTHLSLFTAAHRSMTVATSRLPEGFDIPGPIVLPERFCRQLKRMWPHLGHVVDVWVSSDEVVAAYGGQRLYSWLVNIPEPLDFEWRLAHSCAEVSRLVPIPVKFASKLKGATVVMKEHRFAAIPRQALLTVEGEVLSIEVQPIQPGLKATWSDQMELKRHPDVMARIEPSQLLQAFDRGSFTHIGISEHVVMLGRQSDDLIHVINNLQIMDANEEPNETSQMEVDE